MNGVSEFIARKTEFASYSISYGRELQQAFTLGLWHRKLPDWVFDGLQWYQVWNLSEPMREQLRAKELNLSDQHFVRIGMTSDTATSWHAAYAEFRRLGWQRVAVHREGGNLQYIMVNGPDNSQPDGYRTLYLCFDITISTCRRVQVGTETVPVYETVCDDLVEVEDTGEENDRVPFSGLPLLQQAEPFRDCCPSRESEPHDEAYHNEEQIDAGLPAASPEELAAGDSDIPF